MVSEAIANDAGLWIPGTGTVNNENDKVEKWWEVNREHDRPLTRGATPLVERCMRIHGWNENFANRVLKGYRQFLELKNVMDDWQETKLMPPLPINQMWEQHILDNLHYTDDCYLLFGRLIGHDPDACLNERLNIERLKTTKIAFQARFGKDKDHDVWDFESTEDGSRNEAEKQQHHPSPRILSTQQVSNTSTPATPRRRLVVAASDAVKMKDIDLATMSSARGRPQSVSNDEENSPVVGNETTEVTQSEKARSMAERLTSMSPGASHKSSPGGNEPITISLRDQSSDEETYFSLRYRSQLRIVFTVYAERKGMNQERIKFSYNGQNLTGYETPYSLNLNDRARIDVQSNASLRS